MHELATNGTHDSDGREGYKWEAWYRTHLVAVLAGAATATAKESWVILAPPALDPSSSVVAHNLLV